LKSISIILLAGLAFLFVFIVNDSYITHVFILSSIYIILASYWNMLDGYLGFINFGYAAFFGVGAYASGILSVHLGFPVYITIFIGGLLSAFLGLLITIPCLRMGIFSVAIVTLAFGEIIRIAISLWRSITGGPNGLWGIPPIFEGASRLPYFGLILIILIVMLFGLRAIINCDLGLIFRSIREDEVAASAAGVNVNKYKMLGSSISCFSAGIIGAFYAHYLLTITPSICGITYTVPIMAMSLIGGRGTFLGPIVGAVGLTFLGESIRFLEGFRLLIYGLMMICVMIMAPRGVIGFIGYIERIIKKKYVC
jgi:branched-chain amino acid transport system permease protein